MELPNANGFQPLIPRGDSLFLEHLIRSLCYFLRLSKLAAVGDWIWGLEGSRRPSQAAPDVLEVNSRAICGFPIVDDLDLTDPRWNSRLICFEFGDGFRQGDSEWGDSVSALA